MKLPGDFMQYAHQAGDPVTTNLRKQGRRPHRDLLSKKSGSPEPVAPVRMATPPKTTKPTSPHDALEQHVLRALGNVGDSAPDSEALESLSRDLGAMRKSLGGCKGQLGVQLKGIQKAQKTADEAHERVDANRSYLEGRIEEIDAGVENVRCRLDDLHATRVRGRMSGSGVTLDGGHLRTGVSWATRAALLGTILKQASPRVAAASVVAFLLGVASVEVRRTS